MAIVLSENRDYIGELACVADGYRGSVGELSVSGEHYTFLSRNGKKLSRRKELTPKQSITVSAEKFIDAVDAVADRLAKAPTVINDEPAPDDA